MIKTWTATLGIYLILSTPRPEVRAEVSKARTWWYLNGMGIVIIGGYVCYLRRLI